MYTFITWTVLVSQMVSDRAIFTAKNHTIGERHLTHVKASVSDADNQNPNSWQQGSLDNKIIIVMLRGAKSVEDPESDTGSSDTEPLTVFTNARLAFTRRMLLSVQLIQKYLKLVPDVILLALLIHW